MLGVEHDHARSAADADALAKVLGPGRRLAIIGAGYIGLEVAASARALGGAAVVVEREARVLATQLEGALQSRIAIEQAKGVLAERLGIDVEESFRLLRSYARRRGLLLGEVAVAVANGTLPSRDLA